MKSSGAAAVFYAGYYCDFALFAKALRAAGFTGQLMSDDGSLDPHYITEAGASVATGTLAQLRLRRTSRRTRRRLVHHRLQDAGEFRPRHLLRLRPTTPPTRSSP